MVKSNEPATRSSSRLQKLGVAKPAPVEKKTKPVVEKAKAVVEKVAKSADPKPAAAASGKGKWKVGGQISEIILKDQDDVEVNLNEVGKASGFVVFFYPAANTPGCTNQAICYRDDYEKFVKAGFKVFGCSKGNKGAFYISHSIPDHSFIHHRWRKIPDYIQDQAFVSLPALVRQISRADCCDWGKDIRWKDNPITRSCCQRGQGFRHCPQGSCKGICI